MKLAPRHEVVAVDINPVQLAYAERRFAGGRAVRGAAERVMAFGRALAPAVGWSPSWLRAFLDLDDPAEQTAYWRQHLDTWRFRAAFDALFSLTALRAVYASPFLDLLPRHFGAVIARAWVAASLGTPTARTPTHAHYCWVSRPTRSRRQRRSRSDSSTPMRPPTLKGNPPPASMGLRSRTSWTGPTQLMSSDLLPRCNEPPRRLPLWCSAAFARPGSHYRRAVLPKTGQSSGASSM